eukprot:TRINITY_DN7925_c0_g1_i1.p1 TRINITY_DN7925_c0_g1~~TRINITY_DN7925_c0_g1_i1.p1  ORF type:complete len:566 (-),score=152.67 TRINITY_DN7925_c0_g1_i1:67-1764(-)
MALVFEDENLVPQPCKFYPLDLVRSRLFLHNNRFDEAQKLVNDHKLDWPRYCAAEAEVIFSKSWISLEDEDKKQALEKYEKADEFTKSFLENKESLNDLTKAMTKKSEVEPQDLANWTFDCRLVRATIVMNKALIQMTLGNILKGGYNLRKAWKMLQKLETEMTNGIQIDKTQTKYVIDEEIQLEVKATIGLFYIMIALSPGQFLKVLSIIGFVANRELGLRYLNEAIDKRAYSEWNACLFLMINYLIIPKGLDNANETIQKAEQVVQKVLGIYPDCSTSLNMAAQLELKRGNFQEAMKFLERALESVKSAGLSTSSLDFSRGLVYCYFRDFNSAVSIFDTLSTKSFEMRGFSGLLHASVLHLIGDREKSFQVLSTVPGMLSKTNRFDKLIEPKIPIAKKHGLHLTLHEIMYARRDLHHMKPEDSMAHLEIIEKEFSEVKDDVETKAVYLLLKGAILNSQGTKSEAEKHFKQVLEMKKIIKEQTWVFPNALTELGEMAFFAGDINLAEDYFKQASKSGDYQLKDIVKNRIRLSLEVIQKVKKENAPPSSRRGSLFKSRSSSVVEK